MFDLATKKEIPISDKLFENPYDFEDRTLSWNSDSSQFTFEYNQRGHQVYRVLSVDAKTGAVRAIVNEETKTFFEYSGKKYIHWYDNKQKLLWMSERSGWNHLYRIDASTGSVLNPVTQGNWVVRSIVRTDDEKGQIWLNVGGIYPEQDPYYLHQIRVNYDGTGLVKLTEGDGSHFVTYSPDRKYILDRYSRVDMAPKTELRDAETGKLISVLETADDSDLKRMGWRSPERFVAKGRDGQTDIYGVVYRPMNFDPSKNIQSSRIFTRGRKERSSPKFSGHTIARPNMRSWVLLSFRSTAWEPAFVRRHFTMFAGKISAMPVFLIGFSG